jgi:hypothetical protein
MSSTGGTASETGGGGSTDLKLEVVVIAVATAYASVADPAAGLRRAAAAHGEHGERTGQAAANWPGWYAAHMAAEQAGPELPQ